METKTISALSAKSLPKFTVSIPKSLIKSIAGYGILTNIALSFCALSIDTETAPIGAVLGVFIWFALSMRLMAFGQKRRLFPAVLYRIFNESEKGGES